MTFTWLRRSWSTRLYQRPAGTWYSRWTDQCICSYSVSWGPPGECLNKWNLLTYLHRTIQISGPGRVLRIVSGLAFLLSEQIKNLIMVKYLMVLLSPWISPSWLCFMSTSWRQTERFDYSLCNSERFSFGEGASQLSTFDKTESFRSHGRPYARFEPRTSVILLLRSLWVNKAN